MLNLNKNTRLFFFQFIFQRNYSTDFDLDEFIKQNIKKRPFNKKKLHLLNDSFNSNLEKIKTVPYKHNYGYFFSSGPNTWHGMEKKEIVKERRCLQVNYVSFPTDWKVD